MKKFIFIEGGFTIKDIKVAALVSLSLLVLSGLESLIEYFI